MSACSSWHTFGSNTRSPCNSRACFSTRSSTLSCTFTTSSEQMASILGGRGECTGFSHVLLNWTRNSDAISSCPCLSFHSWVTRLQIVQFMTSFVLLSITVTKYLLPGRACAGVEALAFNTGFNAILLILFIGVLRSGHKHKRAASTRRESSPGRSKKEATDATSTSGLRRSSRKSRKDSF